MLTSVNRECASPCVKSRWFFGFGANERHATTEKQQSKAKSPSRNINTAYQSPSTIYNYYSLSPSLPVVHGQGLQKVAGQFESQYSSPFSFPNFEQADSSC
jgi:hypothetical protein